MRDFHELLRTPHLGRVLLTQVLARLPAGMLSLALLMHVARMHGNYTSAGLVLAGFSVGMAAAGPLVARQLPRVGSTTLLLVTLTVSSAGLVIIALPHVPLPGLLVLAALSGAAVPPVTPTVRVLYPQLAPARLLNGVFSLDAALQEIIWVVGPVLITLIVAMSGTGTALLIVAAVQVIGGLLFALDPAVRRLRVPVTQRRFGKVMRQAPVALMVGLSVLLIGAMAALEAAIVGTFGEGSLNAGAVLAICSAGSLAGGLAAGNRPITRWSLSLRLLVIVAGLAAACLANGFALLAAALFVAGLGIAPALAVMSSVIAGSVDLKDAAEAYGWIGTGQLLGAALGSAVAGIAIDAAGGPGGLLVSLLLAAATLAAASALRSAQPDLTVTLNDGS